MHGAMREVSSADEEFFNPGKRLQSATVRGVKLQAGVAFAFIPSNAPILWT